MGILWNFVTQYIELTDDVFAHAKEKSALLSPGVYLVEYTKGRFAGRWTHAFLTWDPTFGKDGAWFTDKGTIIPFANIWRIAKTEGRNPVLEQFIDHDNNG